VDPFPRAFHAFFKIEELRAVAESGRHAVDVPEPTPVEANHSGESKCQVHEDFPFDLHIAPGRGSQRAELTRGGSQREWVRRRADRAGGDGGVPSRRGAFVVGSGHAASMRLHVPLASTAGALVESLGLERNGAASGAGTAQKL